MFVFVARIVVFGGVATATRSLDIVTSRTFAVAVEFLHVRFASTRRIVVVAYFVANVDRQVAVHQIHQYLDEMANGICCSTSWL